MPKIQGQQMKRSYKNILCVNKVACHDVKKLTLISITSSHEFKFRSVGGTLFLQNLTRVENLTFNENFLSEIFKRQWTLGWRLQRISLLFTVIDMLKNLNIVFINSIHVVVEKSFFFQRNEQCRYSPAFKYAKKITNAFAQNCLIY